MEKGTKIILSLDKIPFRGPGTSRLCWFPLRLKNGCPRFVMAQCSYMPPNPRKGKWSLFFTSCSVEWEKDPIRLKTLCNLQMDWPCGHTHRTYATYVNVPNLWARRNIWWLGKTYIMGITETWWNAENQRDTAIPGYKLYRRDREELVGGVIYIKERVESSRVEIEGGLNSRWVKLSGPRNDVVVLL